MRDESLVSRADGCRPVALTEESSQRASGSLSPTSVVRGDLDHDGVEDHTNHVCAFGLGRCDDLFDERIALEAEHADSRGRVAVHAVDVAEQIRREFEPDSEE